MKRGLLIGAVIATVFALLGGSASAAVAVPARYQLRGHLPELGERPTMRVFVTQAEYDTYRNSLGDALGWEFAGIARPTSPMRMTRPTPKSTTAVTTVDSATAPTRSSACFTAI